MTVGIMQPYFFPYIGYFQLISEVDKMILYNRVNFIKKGWINRNRIHDYTLNPVYITVPILNASSNCAILETKIDNSVPWRKRILSLVYHNYKKAKYFDEIFPIIVKIVDEKTESISEFNVKSILTICNFVGITTPVLIDMERFAELEMYLKFNEHNLLKKYEIDGHFIGKRYVRIVEICRQEGASIYVNPIGGQQIYNKEIFGHYNLQLYFLKTLPYTYRQNDSNFLEHLSIIDVLMHTGVGGAKLLLNKRVLI